MPLETDRQPEAEQRKIYLNWEQFGNGIQELAQKIRYSKHVLNGIYAIPRGGLIIGVALSHALNLPMLSEPQKGCLIVDDINDTGKTLKELVTKYNIEGHCRIATFHIKQKSIIKSDYFIKLEEPETWVSYPYEL